MKALICTTNSNKIKEFKHKLLQVEFYTYKDENISIDIEENGNTFQENALIKLNAILNEFPHLSQKYDLIIAEDSGICVNALNGNPGIYSARYAGEHGNDQLNNQKLLEELKEVEDRNAHYEASIACLYKGTIHSFTGKMNGKIALSEKGNNGFGYDPLFIPHNQTMTLGELTDDFKLEISHRSQAIQQMTSSLGLV